MALWIKKCVLWRFILCSLLVVGAFSVCIQGVTADEQEGPSESQCRPYIEKALKDLEAGESHSGSQEEKGDSGEAADAASGEDTNEQIDDGSVEASEDASAADGESNEEGDDEPSLEVADEPYVDEVIVESDDAEAPKPDESGEGDSGEEGEEPAEQSSAEDDDSKEAAQDDGDSNEASAEDENSEDAEKKEESVEDDANESDENKSGEAEGSDEESQEGQDEQGSLEEVADDSKEDADSKEDDADSKQDDADSKENDASQEQADEAEDASSEQADDGTDESGEQDDSKEKIDESGEQADSKEGDDSKEQTDDSKEQDDDSKEQADDSKEQDDDSKEQVDDSKEQDDDSKEETGDDQADDSQEKADDDSNEQVDDSKEQADDSKEQTDDSGEQDDDSKEQADDSKEQDGNSKEVEDSKEGADESKEQDDSKEADAKEDSEVESEEKSDDSKGKDESKEGDSKEEVEEEQEKSEVQEDEAEAPSDEQEGDESEESQEGEETEAPETPEDDLLLEIEIPENLRSREHIDQLLRLDEESTEAELLTEKSADIILRELKRLYDTAIKPLELLYKYRDLSNRHFGDPEIFSKPLILFMGPWSGGKSSLINYLTDNEFTEWSLRTGAEPSPAYFNILMYGKEPEVLDGTQLAADWTFSGLQKFGQGLEERLRGLKLPNKLLEHVNIVEIPGILEVRKQVSRVFPFNDACQWFIDRADIIFLVYDPSKLDVGPETEAILDQLKGRESQTRIILNKADQVKPEELMRVQSALIWNISPLMSSAQPPVMYTTSLWSIPYESGSPARLLQSQERTFLRDLREAMDKRIENKIASARRFAVRVRNHAKMVDCYLTTYYNHKTIFGNKKVVAEAIIEHPQNYHIYEGLSTLTNISRYDLPDPETYRDFFRLNPLYEFQQLSATCTYFRGCPINRLDVAIAYDLPELVGKYKKMVETATPQGMPKS